MKKIFITILSLCFCSSILSQETATDTATATVDTFMFSPVKVLPITSIKNQSSSGTCWCFSGIGMIESELIRTGKGEYDLSEMFVVYKNYADKAKKFVRMHGATNFSAGGSFADVFECLRDYGIVPNSVQPGLEYGDTIHNHGELDLLTKSYIDAIIKNPNRKLSSVWFKSYSGILDSYLGKCPESFEYEGKTYTPQSFAKSLEINAEDYVSITSFTHHPFYTQFPIEVPDNWRWALSYNLPLDEMMQLIYNAVNSGYTVAWASDVSEAGFRAGVAVIPDLEASEGPGSDQAHWLNLSTKERENFVKNLKGPVPEKKITQAMRQEAFDNFETTDDHGMLIYGTAKDQNDNLYYLVKNSWGTDNKYKGTWYASTSFVAYKTLNIVVHRDAVPKEIKKKLGIK
ncbi:MAG: aminopeptidase [Dysgonamonadaceae bacterium]|jgi:aminopeptidase C|nr:aminopeptidase [Dysgonamonadaceae bacterium]